MSEILNEFIIQPTEALFTVEATNLTVNPEAIQLSIYTGAAPIAGGSNTNVQFNEDGVLQGSNSFTFNNVSEIVTIGNLAIGNVANLGGTSNVKIAGGTNGYVLQTDGTGNLSWTAQAGNVTGNGTPGGSNTQIQYNNSGNFGGSAGFTFDSASNVVNVPGNLIAAGEVTASYFNGNIDNANLANYAGYVVNGNQSNITALGLLANLSVAGTIAGNVISTSGDITSNANIITANGNFIGNLFGTANLAVTVTANAQPNITSVGTLTGLQVNGDINASANTIYANVIQANTVIGNLVFTDLSVTGNLVAGKVTSNTTVQGTQLISNISTGTPPLVVTSTTVVPNLNVANANYSSFTNTVIGASQSNITSLGNLTSLTVVSNNIALGFSSSSNAQSIAIGRGANTNTWGVAIGSNAKANTESVALGAYANSFTQSVAIGYYADGTAQSAVAVGHLTDAGSYGIAIGEQAGKGQQNGVYLGYGAGGVNSIAAEGSIGIGRGAGAEQQDDYAIAIGYDSGFDSQGVNAIAIGLRAGSNTQGINSIAIGTNAGYPNAQANNSIVLNATGANLDAPTANALFVKPIRDVTSEAGFTVALYYNPTTGEIGYK